MNSRQLCSFDIFSLLLGYYSLGFGTLLALKLIIRIIGRGWYGWNDIGAVRELKKCRKINMVNVFSDMKVICCLDLKCSVIFYFTFFC